MSSHCLLDQERCVLENIMSVVLIIFKIVFIFSLLIFYLLCFGLPALNTYKKKKTVMSESKIRFNFHKPPAIRDAHNHFINVNTKYLIENLVTSDVLLVLE